MKRAGYTVNCLFAIVVVALPGCDQQDERPPRTIEKEDRTLDVRRELERKVSVDLQQTDVKVAIENLLYSSRLRLSRQFFVDAIPEGTLDLRLKNVTIKEALNDLTKRTRLRWTIRAESVFVGTSDQVGDIENITDALKEVGSPILRKQLDASIPFCTPSGTPLSEILKFLSNCRGISLVVRSPVNDNAQRFGGFDFSRGVRMRSLLGFLAVNWGLDLVVEKDSVVFVPRRPSALKSPPPPAPNGG